MRHLPRNNLLEYTYYRAAMQYFSKLYYLIIEIRI